MKKQLFNLIKKNPGLRINQIGEQLGSTTQELRPLICELWDQGLIRTKGVTKGTTYYPRG